MLSDNGIPLSPEPLVALAQTGDEAAWATLVTYYSPELSRYLRSKLRRMRCCLEDADDIAQETFTKAWRGLRSLEQASKFKSWLYRIATNVVYDYGRRQSSQRRLSQVSLEQHWEECAALDASRRFEDDVMEGDLVKRVWKEIPWKERQCLHLDMSGNLSRSEIADLVALHPSSVSVYISKGREHCRQAYERLRLDPCGIQQWDSGKGKPSMNSQQKLDPDGKEGENTMDRRAFFRRALALSVTFANPGLRPELLRFTELLMPTTISLAVEEELSLVETLAQTCWQLLPHRANRLDRRHLDYVRSYRHILETWLDSASGAPAMRIAKALSEVTLVEGWLLHALNRQYEAEQACQAAILVAHRAGNVQLESIGVTWLSNFLIDTGQAHRAVDRVQAARRKAEKAGATPLMRAWMTATEADAWANQREGYRAAYHSEIALDRAAALTLSGASESESYPIPYDFPWLYGYRGAVYAHLGHDTQRAQGELERGLASLDRGLLFRRGGFYHDLIIAHSLGKQVEEACQCARLAMNVAEQTQAPIFLRRVQDTTHQFLAPWKESSPVRNLLEEIRLAQQKLAAELSAASHGEAQ
ncbi:MAG TPA: RNA polymerase sigma factor [Ktedonobacteraceae bacterium]|nr:RNA polymerase sigma factor [Ktedonobacteraceae bacterium]